MRDTRQQTVEPSALLQAVMKLGPNSSSIRPDNIVTLKFYSPKTDWVWYVLTAEACKTCGIAFFGYVEGASKEYGEFGLNVLEEFEAVLQADFEPTRLDHVDWSLNEESNRLKREKYPELVPVGKNGDHAIVTRKSVSKRYPEGHRVLLNGVGIGFVIAHNGEWLACASSKKTMTKDLRGYRKPDFETAVNSLVRDRLDFLNSMVMQKKDGCVTTRYTLSLSRKAA